MNFFLRPIIIILYTILYFIHFVGQQLSYVYLFLFLL